MPISATPEMLFSAVRAYHVLNQLAESTNSIVYLAASMPIHASMPGAKPCPSEEQLVVLKKLPRTFIACYELEVHQRVHAHPNILPLLDVVVTEDAIYLVLEYCPAGDLFDAILAIHGDKTLTQRQRESWALQTFRELVCAIQWCHRLGIWHRDIKPENILLAPDGRVQLTDFGLATEHAQTEVRGKGSLFYMAPELFASPNEPFGSEMVDSTRVDIWALGILLLNMLGGRNPWPRAAYDDEAFQIYLSCPSELRVAFNLSDDAWFVLERMLSVDPKYRPSIESVLEWTQLVDQWILPKNTTSKSPKTTARGATPTPIPSAEKKSQVKEGTSVYDPTHTEKHIIDTYDIHDVEKDILYAAVEAELAEGSEEEGKVIKPETTAASVAVTRSASLSSIDYEARSRWTAKSTITRSVSQASTPSYTFSEDSISEAEEEEEEAMAAANIGLNVAPSYCVDNTSAIQLPTHATKVYSNHHPLHVIDHLGRGFDHVYQKDLDCRLDYTEDKIGGANCQAMLRVVTKVELTTPAPARLASPTTVQYTSTQPKPTHRITDTETFSQPERVMNRAPSANEMSASHQPTESATSSCTLYNEDSHNDSGSIFSWFWNMVAPKEIELTNERANTPICA